MHKEKKPYFFCIAEELHLIGINVRPNNTLSYNTPFNNTPFNNTPFYNTLFSNTLPRNKPLSLDDPG